jgi:hypothetical protein
LLAPNRTAAHSGANPQARAIGFRTAAHSDARQTRKSDASQTHDRVEIRRSAFERYTACGRVLLWVDDELVCAFAECPENDASPATNRTRRQNNSPSAQEFAGG